MPKLSSARTTNILLLIVGSYLIIATILFSKKSDPIRTLPIYGLKEYDATKKDTSYHTVLNFKLTDQLNQIITLDSFKHKIFVANFFYAACPGICKKMNSELEGAAKEFRTNQNVKFISYTVDPARDSVPVLAEYAELHNAKPYQWYFLTGEKDTIYNLARKSYFVAAKDGGGSNFVHTQNMALIDTAGHIRGIYSGTDSADVSRMVVDIRLLLKEDGLFKDCGVIFKKS